MNLKILLSLLFLFPFVNAFGQQETYFFKIQSLTETTHIDTELYKKLDSLKRTRQSQDGYIKVLFNRDVDFGFKQKRIQIVLNSDNYQLNLLIKNDTICFSSTTFANLIGTSNPYYNYFNNKHSIPVMDSTITTTYLKLRNRFYHSSKTIVDLKTELDLNEIYALRAGDGYIETAYKKRLDTLARRKNFAALEQMLKSINCETQEYGITGFNLLKKNKIAFPPEDQKIIEFIKKRNSELEALEGDVGPVIWKAYK